MKLPVAALTLGLAAVAQSPRHPLREAPDATRAIAATAGFACVDARGDEVLAVGRRWRATFDHDAVTFLPCVGQHAPRACPVTFAFAGATRGATATPTTLPQRRTDRRHVTFDRGTVIEDYEARPAGLEQTFTFTTPPPGDGDLIVRLRTTTDLQPQERQDGALGWHAPGIGGVTLGTVTGIDAHGRRVAGSLRRAGDEVELVLPDAFVDTAAFPLLLDPLLGPSFEALPGHDSDFPDVAWDRYTDTWCIVWTQFTGGGGSGVVGSVFSGSTLTLQYAFAINQQGNEDSIRVGTIGGLGVFVLAWCNWTAANAITISGMVLDPGPAQASWPFPIAGPGPVDTPAISSEATAFDDDLLVIWDDAQYGICGSTITVGQGLQATVDPMVAIGGGAAATEPAISKNGGNPGLHVVTWVDRPPGLNGWVRAQVVDHDLNLLGAGAWLQNAPEDAAQPAIDGDGFLFLSAWSEQEQLNTTATDIRGRTLTVGPTGITSRGPFLDLAAYPGELDHTPDIAVLGDKFAIAYQAVPPNAAFTDDVYALVLERSGAPCGAEFRLDLNGRGQYLHEHGPRLFSRRDGDDTATEDDGILVFADQDLATADSDIGVQVIEAMGPGGAVTDLGGGCGPGGLATVRGPCALGNAGFTLELFGATNLAIPFAAIGFPGPVQTCGACSLLRPLSFEFAANSGGQATFDLPLPGTPTLVGLTFEFQWVTFGVNYVGCPTAPGIAISNRLSATIDY